jgi:serralysin
MAVVRAYYPTDMSTAQIANWQYLVPTVATSSYFSGYYNFNPYFGAGFEGYGFQYQNVTPVGGTVTRLFDHYEYGQWLAFDVQNISVPVSQLTYWSAYNLTGEAYSTLLAGNDTFYGSEFDDILFGYSGNDWMQSGGGSDILMGDEGLDTAVLPFSSFYAYPEPAVVFGESALWFSDGFNEAYLAGFEQVRFTDVMIDYGDGNWLVDDYFYTSTYRDVFFAGIDPEAHYAANGWREGRNPNEVFDTSDYLAANGDVRAAGVNPLDHYANYGWKEGRDAGASFDTNFYLAANSDVAAAGINPLEHYLLYGAYEGRETALAVFDRQTANGLDRGYYRASNADVAAAGVNEVFHFRDYGWKEGRDPNAYFDTSGYLAANQDVAAAGINPYEHYNQYGWKEGRETGSVFDTASYLSANQDVAAASINPLDHWLNHGINEGRILGNDDLLA